MTAPNVLVLRSPGANCDVESAYAFELAGAKTESIHIRRLLENPSLVDDFQILCLPGGFSYGDDVSAGRVLGNEVRLHLADACNRFKEAGKLVLGICNGFQVLMKTGLLDVDDDQGPLATLTLNDSGHFEARWVRMAVEPGECVFLQGLSDIELPVAHAEGKFVARDQAVFDQLASAGRLVLRYTAADGSSPAGYPANPNGAMGDVAGVCDSTGRVFGLMPHPERFVEHTQHPRWTRGGIDGGVGLKVFENAVGYFR
ncbi:Phosphoribosylformylglycinamidine synthase [Posidoniimonas polymericola]|uniref:Phosphoribosylformylglycinamidine synthase n=1 Tax=Posidoniimonas polymericola TaxID=2528002 RepID=A0A5C5YPJ4_9BACT|nr:phosphoribosylformylglycinamidine synthase I [Posidoniimonas polymericola]TWT76871.1 Phosphoribosylformylglycinamidine synthase [Posidoniimonas polymericola]